MRTEARIKKLKNRAWELIKKGCNSAALQIISAIASFYYSANQKYTDASLEEMLSAFDFPVKTGALKPSADTVLFYDGFGLDIRGLAFIYVKALCEKGYHVIYLVDEKRINDLPCIGGMLQKYAGEMVHIPRRLDDMERAVFIAETAVNRNPASAMLYTTPSDASGVLAFTRMPKGIMRYQINLTDHAFWLGVHAFDYCIEFRNYGASVSEYYRKTDRSALLIQPFYPGDSYTGDFKGFPFERGEHDFVVFSGGALYKTKNPEGTYYQIVRKILNGYPDVKFWYAGFGENLQMDKLCADFKGRVFYTAERKDLSLIMRNCDVYLSTYPISGGLMSQYAAAAGCYPLTLKGGPYNEGVLLDNGDCRLLWDSTEELLQEFNRLYRDAEYREKISRAIRRCVISEEVFADNLDGIIKTGKSVFPTVTEKTDTSAFQKLYDSGKDEKQLQQAVASLRFPALLQIMPFYYGISLLKKWGGYCEGTFDLTVCLVTYNSDWQKVRRTLVSILEQKHVRYELIISDDGSDEDHFEKITKLLESYRFADYRFIKHAKNVGTAGNVYQVYCQAKGMFIRLLGPGDYFTGETQLSQWLDLFQEEELLIAFGDSVYYSYGEGKTRFYRLKNSPRNLWIYRSKRNHGAVRTSYLILNEFICAASFIMFHRQLVLDYSFEIQGKVRYAEDNIFRLMMFDGFEFPYYRYNSCFYEYGSGVSTSGDSRWRRLIGADCCVTEEIMLERYAADRISSCYQKYLRMWHNRKKIRSRLYKYSMFPWAIFLRMTALFVPSCTPKCNEAEKKFYFKITETEE